MGYAKNSNAPKSFALEAALNSERRRYQQKWNKATSSAIRIIPATPAQHAGLQAADYFTWALQRLYEMEEDRYTVYLWPAFRLVMDIDDTHEALYGRYYTQKRPLDRAALGDRLVKKAAPGI